MGDIQFKNHEIAHNFCDVRIHPILTDVLLWIVDLTGEAFITSARRYKALYQKDSGIHLTDPLRAVDLRYYIYDNPSMLADTINKNWQYDNRRKALKCAVLHNTGRGMHFHMQVHDRTKQII